MAKLAAVSRRFGTPCYVYDLAQLRRQVERLTSVLPPGVEVLYSLKANPSPAICAKMASWGLGADVVSIGELRTAVQVGFCASRIMASGPYKSPEMLAELRLVPAALVSVDSLSELEQVTTTDLPNPLLLRLRPDFSARAAMDMGAGSRFGIPLDDISRCRAALGARAGGVLGFHVFAGSQILDAAEVVRQLSQGLDLCLRAAERLGCEPVILNLGGGFGVPYGNAECELDLAPIVEELAKLAERVAPARVLLELGRYLVAQSGWYVTRVVAHQTGMARPSIVVDGGIHQRADLCGLSLRTRAVPPVLLESAAEGALVPTDVLGCLCLPDDVLAESVPLPTLSAGDLLGFPNAGAYGLSASPIFFLGHPHPAEVAFDGSEVELLRERHVPFAIEERVARRGEVDV